MTHLPCHFAKCVNSICAQSHQTLEIYHSLQTLSITIRLYVHNNLQTSSMHHHIVRELRTRSLNILFASFQFILSLLSIMVTFDASHFNLHYLYHYINVMVNILCISFQVIFFLLLYKYYDQAIMLLSYS